MDWSRIPSLAALRAFEALARHNSLSAAARDLNVTHAAIAQHLRALETHFGESLATRDGQTMKLTETGRDLADALGEGFGRIAEGVTDGRLLVVAFEGWNDAGEAASGALAFIATVLEKNRPSQLLFERSGYTRLSPQSWRKDGA